MKYRHEVEADSVAEARKQVLASLAHDHALTGPPTDWVFGVRGVTRVGRARKRREVNTNG